MTWILWVWLHAAWWQVNPGWEFENEASCVAAGNAYSTASNKHEDGRLQFKCLPDLAPPR